MSCKTSHHARPAGREIDRSQYAQAVEENNKRYQETHNYTEHGKR
jgi:hypothetical protein